MLIDWSKQLSGFVPGDWAFHPQAGVAGRVKKVWGPGTYSSSEGVSARDTLPVPVAVECLELEDGNVMLSFEADGQPAFEHCREVEAVYFRQVQALVRHDLEVVLKIAKAGGVDFARARGLAVAALRAQLAELSK